MFSAARMPATWSDIQLCRNTPSTKRTIDEIRVCNGQGYHLLAMPLRCIRCCRLPYKDRKKKCWTLLYTIPCIKSWLSLRERQVWNGCLERIQIASKQVVVHETAWVEVRATTRWVYAKEVHRKHVVWRHILLQQINDSISVLVDCFWKKRSTILKTVPIRI
jgi:hypothetical protein